MSQNKTVIQGLEPADNSNYSSGVNPSFYSRNGGSRPAARGTIVSGMTGGQPVNMQKTPNETIIDHPLPQGSALRSGKPIIGFLFSVSRTPAGEFWPLQIGQNTIGQNPDCDVVLPEGTVSAEHAVLVVRKMKNPEKVIASISDARSTNGTMLNGVSLRFTAEECKNGDIITIGDNYELYLILVDAVSLNLTVSKNFIHIEEDPAPNMEANIPSGGYTRPIDQYGPPQFGGGYAPGGGTMGFDGSSSNERGGTVGM